MSAIVWAVVLFAGAFASSEPLGSITTIEEFPSLVQVDINLGIVWVQQCAGSIITNNHILTTAYCFSGPLYYPQYRRIRVGSSYRGREGQIYGVHEAFTHEDYGLLGNDADIAVVRLTSYLTLGPTVQRVPILGQGIELPFGLQVQHAGWGTTSEGGEVSNAYLHTLNLYVNDNENCLLKYFPEHITENMVCVGLGYFRGRDFDSRDIGAPLFYSDTLVGFLSFGEIADDEYPAVATAVGSYSDWIISKTI